ncbi:MAG: zinc ribbon domain-containing protein [Bacteroidota bacterium]
MTGEDLYIEEQCTQCGQKKLKNASFCPHCGYVKKKGWLDTLGEVFGRGKATDGSVGGLKGPTVSMMIGMLFAGYLVYSAIEKNSVQSFIMALLVLFAVLQSWYSGRKKTRNPDRQAGVEGAEESDLLENKFFCENCSTRVDAEALECPKCGMKFGQRSSSE